MPVLYGGAHSIDITIGNTVYNTWTNWGLIPASRPYVNLPQPNVNVIPLPGTSKMLDLTEVMPGGLTFSPRQGDWEFYIDNTRWTNWYTIVNRLQKILNGKKVSVKLRDDINNTYTGRITISNYDPGNNFSKIVFTYVLYIDQSNINDNPSETIQSID